MAASGEVDLDLSRPSPPLSPLHLDPRSWLEFRRAMFGVDLFFCFNKQYYFVALVFL